MAQDKVLLHADTAAHERRKEAEADGTITPGDIIEHTGEDTSRSTTERLFTRADTDGVRMFHIALVQSYAGRGKSDDYSDGDTLVYKAIEPGEEYDAFVFDGSNAAGSGTDVSSNANISVGDELVPYSGSGEAGALRQFDSSNDDEGAVVAEAKEAVDNSGGSSKARIHVEGV